MEKIINMFSRKNTTQEERRARAVSPSRPKRLRDESPTPESMEDSYYDGIYNTANEDYKNIMKRKREQLQHEEEERKKQEQQEQLLQREEERKKNYEYWNETLPGMVDDRFGKRRKIGGRILKNNNKKPKKVLEKVKKPKKISEKVKNPKKISEKVKKPKKISEKVKKPKKVSEKVKKPKKVSEKVKKPKKVSEKVKKPKKVF